MVTPNMEATLGTSEEGPSGASEEDYDVIEESDLAIVKNTMMAYIALTPGANQGTKTARKKAWNEEGWYMEIDDTVCPKIPAGTSSTGTTSSEGSSRTDTTMRCAF